MPFLQIVEYFFFLFVVLVAVSQIIIPLLKDEPWFPFFSNERTWEKEITQARQEIKISKLQQELVETKSVAQSTPEERDVNVATGTK